MWPVVLFDRSAVCNCRKGFPNLIAEIDADASISTAHLRILA